MLFANFKVKKMPNKSNIVGYGSSHNLRITNRENPNKPSYPRRGRRNTNARNYLAAPHCNNIYPNTRLMPDDHHRTSIAASLHVILGRIVLMIFHTPHAHTHTEYAMVTRKNNY